VGREGVRTLSIVELTGGHGPFRGLDAPLALRKSYAPASGESSTARGGVLGAAVLGVGLSSADQCRIADTAGQFCLGSAPGQPHPLAHSVRE
jgi:hypothetical protein